MKVDLTSGTARDGRTEEVVQGVYFLFVALTMLIPGLSAVILRSHRSTLRNTPAAGSLSSFVLAMIAGLLIYSIFCFSIGGDLEDCLRGSASTISLFIGSFGIIFPLAIPIISSIIVFVTITRSGSISRVAWGIACSIETLGWVAAYVTGLVAYAWRAMH